MKQRYLHNRRGVHGKRMRWRRLEIDWEEFDIDLVGGGAADVEEQSSTGSEHCSR